MAERPDLRQRSHASGFTAYMRDYDVIIEVPAIRPDGSGSYIEGRYRYRFTHCVEAAVKTKVPPDRRV